MADCEVVHGGLLDEPVNAASSLAYVAAGAFVFRHNRVHGVALMAVGAGSFAFHAFDGIATRLLHDGTIAVAVLLLLLALPRIARAAPFRPGVVTLGVVAFVAALPLEVFGRTGGVLCQPDRVWQAHAGWHVLTAIAIAAVASLAASSRTPEATGSSVRAWRERRSAVPGSR